MHAARAPLLLLAFFSVTLAHATSQRTFVASAGMDTNTAFNCSIANPCRGFAAALGVTSAKGEVIVLDSAAYGVIPAIIQSVTITAPPGVYAGISVFSGDGITINAGAADTVVLRGLTINGQGGANGITITNALVVHVENCVIANMAGIGINQLNGLLEVKDTIVRNNANIGVYVQGPAQANLDHVRLEANDTGLAAEIGGVAAMQDSVVTGSNNIGVAVTDTPSTNSQVTISHCLIASNNYGLFADGSTTGNNISASIAVYESAISSNNVGVHVSANHNPASYSGRAHLKHDMITANGKGVEVINGGLTILDGNHIWGNGALDLIVDLPSFVQTSQTNIVGDPSVAPGSALPITPF